MTRKILTITIVALLALYVVSYMWLSSKGEYVPSSWGLAWVKGYVWAPRGFVSGPMGLQWNRQLQTFFLPLWWADVRFIHTWSKAGLREYPINTALDDRLQRRAKGVTAEEAKKAAGTTTTTLRSDLASTP
jgi:hypothetical protein